MKRQVFFLFGLFVFAIESYGQDRYSYYQNAFTSRSLEYLKFINDSTLLSSLILGNDTGSYFIRKDTLFIKESYIELRKGLRQEIIKWHNYTIIKRSQDSLTLIKISNNGRQDTLKFTRLEIVKETIRAFKLLKMDYWGPFAGRRKVTIDSLGKVTFEAIPAEKVYKEVPVTKLEGALSKSENKIFLEILSKSQPSKLRIITDCSNIDDAPNVKFEIRFDDKIIKSENCKFKWIHSFLINYLFELEENKGFVNRKKS